MGIDPISIGLMAAGTLISGIGSMNQASEQRHELQARQRMQDYQAQQQRLDQIRQSRIAQARIIQGGVNQGAGESTSLTTGASGVVGQGESNVNQISNEQGMSDYISHAQMGAVNAQQLQKMGSGITDLGANIFQNDKYISGKIKDIFGS